LHVPWRGVGATGEQIPGASIVSHASHGPWQARSQQSPSAQIPLAHWFWLVHALPLACVAAHVPMLQKAPCIAQSASVAQAVEHTPLVHADGEQSTSMPRHWPAPLHSNWWAELPTHHPSPQLAPDG
jgi:hypothetical protein